MYYFIYASFILVLVLFLNYFSPSTNLFQFIVKHKKKQIFV